MNTDALQVTEHEADRQALIALGLAPELAEVVLSRYRIARYVDVEPAPPRKGHEIKQYHTAVFAEVDTTTGQVLRVAEDAEAWHTEPVYNVTTEEWEYIDFHDPDEAALADKAYAAITSAVRRQQALIDQA